MSTPNPVYNSNAVPFGGFSVNVYRGQANPQLLGEYILESASPADNAVEGDRPGVDGSDNGWWLVDGKTEGSAVFQIATAATPTLKNGDFFKSSRFSTDSAGAGEARLFVIKGPTPAVGTTEYRKQSGTIREDKHGAALLAQLIEV